MAGRLRVELLERFGDYAVRILRLTEQLDRDRRPRRVVDQLVGSGTSCAAQMYEANEAVSRLDFLKSLGIGAKELSETKFWLLTLSRMEWFAQPMLNPLMDETEQLMSIVKAMKVRTRRNGKPSP